MAVDHLGETEGIAVWEYSIIALPRFEAPTTTRSPDGSASVVLLNREGELGWEAVGMTALQDGTVAVLLKRARDR